jgi:uncharacterized membrane protein
MIAPAIARSVRETSSWWVFASIALNVFLIGTIAAYTLRHQWSEPGSRGETRIERLAATLPPPDADTLRRAIAVASPEITKAKAALRDAQDAVRQALLAEPYDGAATDRAMAQMRAKWQGFGQALHAAIARAALDMSQAGRTKLAEWPTEH